MSRRLSPIDIEHAEFSSRVRGLDKGEVREFLSRVALEIADGLKERQVLERRLTAALEQSTQLQAEVDRLEEAVLTAELSGADVKERAEREAQLLIAEAETVRRHRLQEIDAAAQRERFELSRLKHERGLFKEQFRGLLEAYTRSLDGLEPGERASERTDRALLDDSVGSEP